MMNPNIIQPIDYTGMVQRGFQMGQQQRKEAEMDKALQALSANPNDPQAIAGITRHNPQLGMQLQQRQAAEEQKKADELKKVFGHAARAAKTPQQWDAIAGYLAQNGVPGAENVVGKFSPEMRISYMAQAGLEDDAQDPTSMQRNYEFIKQLNPELAEQYIRGQAEGSPIVQRNDDGTMTVFPRSMLSGAQPQAAPPPPPPGFVIDGGPTPPASGNFPAQGSAGGASDQLLPRPYP